LLNKEKKRQDHLPLTLWEKKGGRRLSFPVKTKKGRVKSPFYLLSKKKKDKKKVNQCTAKCSLAGEGENCWSKWAGGKDRKQFCDGTHPGFPGKCAQEIQAAEILTISNPRRKELTYKRGSPADSKPRNKNHKEEKRKAGFYPGE